MVRQDMIDEGRNVELGRLLDAPLPTRGDDKLARKTSYTTNRVSS